MHIPWRCPVLRKRLWSHEPILLAYAYVFYFFSIGPVVAGLKYIGIEHKCRSMLTILYAPIIMLHDTTFLDDPIEWYAALWGWH